MNKFCKILLKYCFIIFLLHVFMLMFYINLVNKNPQLDFFFLGFLIISDITYVVTVSISEYRRTKDDDK